MRRGSRRSRGHGEAHPNAERWLVSYADFITLLFAFFVVMYSISQVNEGKYRVLSDALVNAFQTVPGGSRQAQPGSSGRGEAMIELPVRRPGEIGRRRAEARLKDMSVELRDTLSPLVTSGQVRITETPRGLAVDIDASLLFAPGQAELSEQAQRTLGAVAQVLARQPNAVEVEGHTDDSPISNPVFPSNWELSAARASRVVRLFAASGVAPGRMVAVGYGEHRSIGDNATAEGRARNRRVTVMVLTGS